MTAYRCDLNRGQQIYFENQGTQTTIRLLSTGIGQQQSTSSSFETGKWHVPPTVYRTEAGFIIQIKAEQGQRFIQVQAHTMSVLNASPSLSGADSLPIQQVETATGTQSNSTIPPMEPMKPMEPIKTGNMQMNTRPMEMRMGNMEMRMGEPLKLNTPSAPKQSVKNFCPQCGSKVEAGDRFCSNCGNRLVPDGN